MAIRITRPYTTEDEFLEQELETLSRTSVTLLGAQPRPQGVVLRFELVLSSGHVLMRGEGRVVGFRPNLQQGLGGLTLRFTRLDTRSKALVDKAATVRERRRPSSARPDGAEAFSPPPPHAEEPRPLPSPPEASGEAPLDLESTHAEAPAAKRSEHPPPMPSPTTSASPRREELLERLRSRARGLAPDTVEQILEHKRRHA